MFSGGDYDEVTRWLANFVAAHAKREDPRVEAVLEADGPREGKSYGVRLELGGRLRPAAGAPALELAFPDVAAGRGSLAWCGDLAERLRTLARELVSAEQGARQPA
jgi:hypothetical protein